MTTLKEFEKEFTEVFGFILAQELAKAAPKDTGRLARSFPGTVDTQGNTIIFTLPFYYNFVEFSPLLVNNKPNPNFAFTRKLLETQADSIAEKTLKAISSK